MYDYLIVGSGLYGAVCAYELSRAGKSVLAKDFRSASEIPSVFLSCLFSPDMLYSIIIPPY